MKTKKQNLVIVAMVIALAPILQSCSPFAALGQALPAASTSLGSTLVTTPTPTPTGATTSKNAQVQLAWTAPSPAPQGYTVEQSSDGVTFALQQTISTNVTNANVTGLTSGQTYYFRVNAVNVYGSSAYSVVVTAVIP
jgi:hypothetical protein